MVCVSSPFLPFCLKVLSLTFNCPAAVPPSPDGLSFQVNFKEKLPLPFAIILDPSELNFAVTPGDGDRILSLASISPGLSE